MNCSYYKSFSDFLESKNIYLNSSIKVNEKETLITKDTIKEYMLLLNEFHKRVEGFNGYMNKSPKNDTGRLFEDNKIQLKKTKRYIEKIKKQGAKNEIEKLIENKNDIYVEAAEKSVEIVNAIDYHKLLKRSMDKIELCLGGFDFNDFMNSEGIFLKSVDKCCYDMVEIDFVKLFIKVKRKEKGLNWGELIEYYCSIKELDSTSFQFISALLLYPYEYFKCINRYREGKKGWSEEEFLGRLKNAMYLEE